MYKSPSPTRIILDRLNKEAWRYSFPFIGDLLIGILEDIDAAEDKGAVYRALDELREEVNHLYELLEHPKLRATLDQVRKVSTLQENVQLEVDETISNFVKGLKDPFGADLDPKFEAVIEAHALSQATLLSTTELRDGKDLLIRIGDLEVEKLFYPLHFIGERLQNLSECKESLQAPPLNALFDHTPYRGYPKWICVVLKPDTLTLTAYPAPINVESTGRGEPVYFDSLAINRQNPSAKCEYWPRGDSGPRFTVDMSLQETAMLRFRDNGDSSPTILSLEFTYKTREASQLT